MTTKNNGKEIKKGKKKKTNLGVKIFVWFMFAAMLMSFVAPILYYLISAK